MAGIVTDEPPIVVPEPNPFWKKNAECLVGGSIAAMEDTAKQIIVVSSLLEGLYFHAITFSDLRGELEGFMLAVYLSPLALWLAGLSFAMLTLSRKDYQININSSSDSKQVFEAIVKNKYYRLKMAEVFLFASFLPLIIAVYYYLTTKPPV
jgi:hypothetical protein